MRWTSGLYWSTHTHNTHTQRDNTQHTYTQEGGRERGKEGETETERCCVVPCILSLSEDSSILFVHDVNFASILENQLFSKVVFSHGKWETQGKG